MAVSTLISLIWLALIGTTSCLIGGWLARNVTSMPIVAVALLSWCAFAWFASDLFFNSLPVCP